MAERTSRLARWRGLVGVGWRRVHHRLGSGGSRQTLVGVFGIAIPVALLLLVASVSLGLAADPATGDDADYWVVPEQAGSAVTDVSSAQLGGVHPVAERVTQRDDVVHATPMLIEFVSAEGDTGESVFVLVIGVVPSESHERVAPLSTTSLTPGDPYYDDGTYDGLWTGEAVLSESAASELGVEEGEAFDVRGSDEPFTVSAVETPRTAGLAQLPLAVVHLSELQSITGSDESDSANQLVVVAPEGDSSTEAALSNLYGETTVETRGGLLVERGMDSRLPAAMSLAALLIALVTGTLLVSTAFGFELAADSRQREVLSALGVSSRSRATIIGTELGVVSLYGGSLGVGLWAVGALVINYVGTSVFGAPVAAVEPQFVAYGVAVALLIGALSLPYLVAVSWRSGGEVTLR